MVAKLPSFMRMVHRRATLPLYLSLYKAIFTQLKQ